jgi:hypothetical protein
MLPLGVLNTCREVATDGFSNARKTLGDSRTETADCTRSWAADERSLHAAAWKSKRGKAPCQVPYGHWNTITLSVASRTDRIETPGLLDAPINGAGFRIYVESVLVHYTRAK